MGPDIRVILGRRYLAFMFVTLILSIVFIFSTSSAMDIDKKESHFKDNLKRNTPDSSDTPYAPIEREIKILESFYKVFF